MHAHSVPTRIKVMLTVQLQVEDSLVLLLKTMKLAQLEILQEGVWLGKSHSEQPTKQSKIVVCDE